MNQAPPPPPTRLSLSLTAPVLVALAIVMDTYAAAPDHWTSALRAGLVVGTGAAALTAICVAVLRRPFAAAAIATALVIAVGVGEYSLFVAGVAIAVLFIAVRVGRSGRSMPDAGPFLVAASAILFILAAARLPLSGAVTIEDFTIHGAGAPSVPDGERPNIYVALLDGYPRADWLAAAGIDNAAFMDRLSRLGFDISHLARSPYPRTDVVIASMLRPESALELERFINPADFTAARREVRREYLVPSPILDSFHSAGYRLINVPPPTRHATPSGWDEVRSDERLNSVEVSLIRRSALAAPLAGFVMDQHRAGLDSALGAWAAGAPRPSLLFAHIMSPHPPFLWRDEGASREAPECWVARDCPLYDIRHYGWTQAEHTAALSSQIKQLNLRVLSAVESIVRRDPDAIVVLLSDHGSRFGEDITEEWHSIFFAARVPNGTSPFPRDASPVGLFAGLLDVSGGQP